MIFSGSEPGSKLILPFLRQPLRVLDHVSIHVDDPQRSIGSGSDHHRPTPAVLAGEKIGLRTQHVMPCLETDSVLTDHIVLDEVMKRLTGKCVLLGPTFEQIVIAVNQRRTRRCESTGLAETVVSLLQFAGGIHRRVGRCHYLMLRVWRSIMGIPSDVLVRENIMPQRVTVLDAKPTPPIIADPAVLRGTTQRIQETGIRTEAKIPTANAVFNACFQRSDLAVFAVAAMMTPTGTVNPIIKSPPQSVDSKLLISLQEPRVESPLHICFSITSGIFQIKNLRCCCDEDSIAPHQDTGRKTQTICKERGLVVPSIGIGILQKRNASAFRSHSIHAKWVVRHFHHPQSSIRPPINRNRVSEQRF